MSFLEVSLYFFDLNLIVVIGTSYLTIKNRPKYVIQSGL